MIDGDFVLFQKPDENGYGFCPKNGAYTFSFQKRNLSREDAYNKAVKIIMVDPRYRICDIALCAGKVYTVRCWEASEREEMTFECVSGEHVLFYRSREILFRWKERIAGKE